MSRVNWAPPCHATKGQQVAVSNICQMTPCVLTRTSKKQVVNGMCIFVPHHFYVLSVWLQLFSSYTNKNNKKKIILATSTRLFHVGQCSQCRLFLTPTLLRPGISSLCHMNCKWTGWWAGFDVLCDDFCVCVRYWYLILLTFLSTCEGTDTMKIRVSDQPSFISRATNAAKFSHLIPAPRWQPNTKGPDWYTAPADNSC